MFEHEIRWYVLLPVSFLLGMAALSAEIAGVWFRPDMRPDLFWCMAFFITLRTTPLEALAAFAWCGFARDALLGPKLGSAAIAYILVGWSVLYLRYAIVSRGWFGQMFAAGATAFVAALLRHVLDAGRLAASLWDTIFFLAIGDAVLSLIAYAPLCALLALAPFRPWRRRSSALF